MRFVIVTGMSGAGKSSVLKMLEDVGYFCMDNLPVSLVPKLTELLSMPNSSIDKVALGMDIRSRYGAGNLGEALDQLDERNVAYEVLFLDAKDNVLIKRYKETRRSHPAVRNRTRGPGDCRRTTVTCAIAESGGLYFGYQQTVDTGSET